MTESNSRTNPRHAVLTAAQLALKDMRLGSVEVVDLSEGGAGVILGQAAPLETKGHITLRLLHDDHQHLIQAECRVTNCCAINDKQFHVGLQFTRFMQPSSQHQRLLTEWQAPTPNNHTGPERRRQSYLDLTHATMRSLAEILSSTDPRARSAASRAINYHAIGIG